MRYQANGANPERLTNSRNGLMTTSDGEEGHDEADRRSRGRASGESWCRTSSRSCANAAAIVGIARKNENSAAAGRSRPMAMPPTIVAPERETPGMSASV